MRISARSAAGSGSTAWLLVASAIWGVFAVASLASVSVIAHDLALIRERDRDYENGVTRLSTRGPVVMSDVVAVEHNQVLLACKHVIDFSDADEHMRVFAMKASQLPCWSCEAKARGE